MSIHTHAYIISPYLLLIFYIRIRTTQYVSYIKIIYSYVSTTHTLLYVQILNHYNEKY